MKVSSRVLSILIPATVIVGIFFGEMSGWWKTESSKEPIAYGENEFGGAFAGLPNPADIRGSYSLGDIETAFGIPVAVLAEAFLLSDEENPEAVLLKEFEERYGILPGEYAAENDPSPEFEIGTDAMRLFVARYLGLPYEAESDTGIFAAAYQLIIATADSMESVELNDLERRVVQAPHTSAGSNAADILDELAVSDESVVTNEPNDEEYLVKGNTTFGQILSWGVSEDDIREILGGDMGTRGEQIRTWCIEREIAYSSVKEELQRRVDEVVR
jgi:hypothetical protein